MNLSIQHSDFGLKNTDITPIKFPLPMQYMGGKGRIVDKILDGISSRFTKTNKFIDLFAGSGVVSFEAMLRGYQVSANDIQPYSSVVLSSMLNFSLDGIDYLINKLSNISDNEIFSHARNNYLADYNIERNFINDLNKNLFNWDNYRNFCESTFLCSGKKSEIDYLKKHEQWSLFLAYYRNTYFGIKQSAEIDYLRELSEGLDENLKCHLMASVISSLTYCVSSTTHLAQFLKPTTEKNTICLLKKRALKITDMVIQRLKLLKKLNFYRGGVVLNSDFKDAIKDLNLSSNCIVYADPPYFKEHYSRYYHVLDTFVLYDYPELTFNKRINGITKGRYRKNRIVSDFGKKNTARNAFSELCDSCNIYGNKLAISYACSSIVEKDFFYNIAKEKHLDLNVLEFELVHTGQGQARHKKVTEFLFLLSNE
ncbi:DNA adenine methylase [Legionella feeleii]|uniref:Modification methylase FokI n=1 Tax=Legionella feeleii TaxID=453 RepID=A0A0W0TM06_9GAMM|nr:DNA adenine methylase [Legionella feeleii]KTC96634.1 Modification methylase FokI [Legionella feeleii]SPX60707.1 Modification methylase FokI [Legionella feeleii]